MSDGHAAARAVARRDVIGICQPCHNEVEAAFRQSMHFRRASRGELAPTCTDCHSSAGGQVLSGNQIPQRCATCHKKGGVAGKAWVTEKAPHVLRLLRRVTLARTVTAEGLDALERLGASAASFHTEMDKVRARFRDIPFEWHRFNLRDAEARSSTALEILESLHTRVDRRLARIDRDLPASRPPAELAPTLSNADGRPLRLAVASMASPSNTYEQYVGLLGDLARRLGRPYRLVQRRTYKEINDLLLRGKLDLAFICSGGYAALPDPEAAVEIIAYPIVAGKTVYHSLIVVRADSSIRHFADLRGKRFAFTDPLSNTGYLYPVFRLAQRGERPESFFSATLLSGSHDRSIEAVYHGLADGAAVDNLVFNQLVTPGSLYWGRLRVIETSPDFPMPPVVAPTSVPAELRARMREFLLHLPASPQGRQRLAALGFDGFAAGGEKTYGSIRDMLAATAGDTN